MLMDMRLLLISFAAIERICTYEKGKSESSEKSSHKSKKGKKRPGTKAMDRVPKKIHFEKHCDLCKKHGGTYTTHNTRECRRFEKDGKEKANFRTAKKDGKKNNPVNHNFAQLTEKIEKLEKALKKSGKKGKKRRYKDSNPDSEEGVGSGSTRKLVKFETVVQMSFTPPSPIKATPTTIASESNNKNTKSVSNAGDVMMTSSSQTKVILRKKVFYLTKTHLKAKPLQ